MDEAEWVVVEMIDVMPSGGGGARRHFLRLVWLQALRSYGSKRDWHFELTCVATRRGCLPVFYPEIRFPLKIRTNAVTRAPRIVPLPLPNESIPLATESARVQLGKETCDATLTASVAPFPRPHVMFELAVPALWDSISSLNCPSL